MTTTRSQPTPAKSLDPASRHVWTNMIETGLAVGVALFLFALTKIHAFPAGALALVLSGSIAAGISIRSKSSPVVICAVAVAVTVPGWLVYAKLTGVWHWPALVSLVAVVGAVIVAGGLVWERHDMENRQASNRAATFAAAAARRKLIAAFTRIGLTDIQISRIEESRGNRIVYLRLPTDGSVTLNTLRTCVEKLCIPLKMDPGAITFEGGKHGGEVIMTLNEEDIFAETVLFPEHDEVLTITKPIPVGMAAVGALGRLLFREVATFLTGLRGWGKSNLLNVLIAQFSACEDAITWCVDLGGGSLSGPWIQPWINDEVLNNGAKGLRPCIDWVATTREEAYLMFKAADRLVEGRRNENAGKRRTKLVPSRAKPALVILGDEVADIFMLDAPREKQQLAGVSNVQMVAWANDITRKGRPSAVDPIWTTQRPTISQAGSGDLKSQCGLKITLGQMTEMDARSAVPDSDPAAKAIARLAHVGTGLIWQMGDRDRKLKVWKFFRLDPGDEHPEDRAKVDRIAARCSVIRPVFDEADLAVLGEDYAERWNRSELFQSLAPEPPATAAPAHSATATAVIDREAQKRAQLAEFQEMMGDTLADLSTFAQGYTPQGNAPAWKLRAYALIAERALLGIATNEIFTILKKEGIGVDRSHIQRELGKDRDAGLLDSRNGRWYPKAAPPAQQ
jgi:hypothetical protein